MSTSNTKKSNTRNYSYTCYICNSPYTGHREQADKAKQQAGKVTEQAKGRLKTSTDGDQDSMDDPWEVDTDTALAGDDQESPRG